MLPVRRYCHKTEEFLYIKQQLYIIELPVGMNENEAFFFFFPKNYLRARD